MKQLFAFFKELKMQVEKLSVEDKVSSTLTKAMKSGDSARATGKYKKHTALLGILAYTALLRLITQLLVIPQRSMLALPRLPLMPTLPALPAPLAQRLRLTLLLSVILPLQQRLISTLPRL